MRRCLLIVLPFLASLAVAGSAQAVVVDVNAIGSGTSVAYDASDQSGYYGVALVPGTSGQLSSHNIPIVTSSAPCTDPAIPSGLTLQDTGLCFHGGTVLHANETFVLDWEPGADWGTTTGYIEQFLRDLATASGRLTSPYALTTQYTDATGRAGNKSLFGGGCVDGGSAGNSSCEFGGTGPVHGYPANGCTPTGSSTGLGQINNTVCLTDGQLQAELQTMINQEGILGHLQPGYSPVLVMLTPPGVETCLDSVAGGTLCSANSTAPARFCSYHAQVNVGGTLVSYIVQPWTAFTSCDEPDAPQPPANPSSAELQTDVGAMLVSPLSQAQIAAIVNPAMNGWFALGGAEVNDNQGCSPLKGLDGATLGADSYILQREYNNAASIVDDPDTYFGCAPNVFLTPSFVPPSPVNPGDTVEFDGSPTGSTLLVPNADYSWDFGDGNTANGFSVVHTYSSPGNYTVKLTVTDRGGNVASFSQVLQILGNLPTPVTGTTNTAAPALTVKLQLLPQSLRSVLSRGINLRVSSNEPANGFATLSISRRAAKRAHIRTGRKPFVVIGTGTTSQVKDGTVTLHLRMSRSMARKLRRLRHVAISVRLALVDSAGKRTAVDVAGNY